jgi:hypothetical protein
MKKKKKKQSTMEDDLKELFKGFENIDLTITVENKKKKKRR